MLKNCRRKLSLLCLIASAADASVTISSTPNPAVVGQAVTLSAVITPSSPTEKVTFYDGMSIIGTVTASNGNATLTATQLGAGKHKLYARPVVGIGSPSEASSPVVQIITAKPGGTFVKSNSQPAA